MPYKDPKKRAEVARVAMNKKYLEWKKNPPFEKTCEHCGTVFRAIKKKTRFCTHPCAMRANAKKYPSHRTGKRASNFKGGTTNNGYRMLYDPSHPMADKAGYVAEHRAVMSAALGRPLLREEVVHHKDGNRSNNAIENLELLDNRTHAIRHHQQSVTCPECNHAFRVVEQPIS